MQKYPSRNEIAALYPPSRGLKAQKCVFCKKIGTDPRRLPCNHIRCFNCIRKRNAALQIDRKTLRCPVCIAVVNISGGDISKLPSASFTHKADDALKMQYDKQSQRQHRTNTLNNTIIPLKETVTLPSVMKPNVNIYINNNQIFCKEKFHEYNRLEYYCKTCQKRICQKCATTAHNNGHDNVSIEEATVYAKKRIKEGAEDHLYDLLVKCEKNENRFQNEVDAAKEKIRNQTRANKQILQDEEDALIANLDNVLEQRGIAIKEKKGELGTLKRRCETMKDNDVLEGVEELVVECNTAILDKSALLTEPVTVRFIPNEQVNHQMQNFKLGEIVESVPDPSRCSIESLSDVVRCGFINEFVIVTRNAEGNACYASAASIDVRIQDTDGEDLQEELTEIETGRFLVKYTAKRPSPYKITVSIGGREITNSPQNVETIEDRAELNPLRCINAREICRPIVLAVSEKGEIAVVNDDSKNGFFVVLFSADGKYVRGIGAKESGAGQLIAPSGIVFNEGKILVSDNPHKIGCIKEFDVDGTYKRKLCELT